ncbi:S8 family serine peptidase [Streptomyces sp. PSKA30]|uniref:S8 family serine peptidase n=1 Tax=Streptomyces sp. PSKA30 TaxID=2874597 RepID=UPI001CD0CBB8|nr:S8 family serine peptidase [Streptomyces sp. PSKA30]MBZ9640893.1 S8 family serine peptidase [Streptomyces sp. PSKA30]
MNTPEYALSLTPTPPRASRWLSSTRPPRRSRLAATLVVTATVAPLLLPPAALAAEAATTSAKPVKLPLMPVVLDERDACTAASPQMVRAEPRYQRTLALKQSWRFSRGKGVDVAVVDTGVDTGTARLDGRVTPVSGSGDCVGHGSFLAGLVAAAPKAGTGFSGVAPEARILSVRGTDERGVATAATVAAGVRAAADAGAQVILVGPALARGSSELMGAVEHAIDQGALVVAAASPQLGSLSEEQPARDYWPAAQRGVLAVLGTADDGSLPDGTAVPRNADLAAPGSGVIGVGPRGEGHFIGSGSALAAAFVAGAAALVRGTYPELSAVETAERLTRNAYPADVPRIDVYAALSSSGTRPAEVVEPSPAPARMPSHEATEAAVRRGTLLAVAGAVTAGGVAWAGLAVHVRRRRSEDAAD